MANVAEIFLSIYSRSLKLRRWHSPPEPFKQNIQEKGLYVKDKIRTMVNGFCMALADSVPGVSGGTIAFIMGFYENLLNSFHGLLFEQGEKRKESGSYLIKLGCGC